MQTFQRKALTGTRSAILLILCQGWMLPAASEPLPAGQKPAGTPRLLTREGTQPRVAVGGDGVVAIAYGSGKTILCSVSTDGGRTFSASRKVATVEELALGMRRGPQIAVTQDYILISAIGRDKNVLAWRSGDDGKTWAGPFKVNDRGASAPEGLHALCAGPGNEVFAVWLDLREGGQRLYTARSLDGGHYWSPNTLIYASPEGTVCECCQPSVTADQEGHVYAMWRNWLQGARDMYLAASQDRGLRFGQAQKLGSGTWPLNACPMDGGGLTVDRAGQVITVWRRDRELLIDAPGQPEQRLDTGKQGTIAAGPDGPYILWQSGENIMARMPSPATPVRLGRGTFPSVASAPGGQPPVVAAWESPTGIFVLELSAHPPKEIPQSSRRRSPGSSSEPMVH